MLLVIEILIESNPNLNWNKEFKNCMVYFGYKFWNINLTFTICQFCMCQFFLAWPLHYHIIITKKKKLLPRHFGRETSTTNVIATSEISIAVMLYHFMLFVNFLLHKTNRSYNIRTWAWPSSTCKQKRKRFM